MKRSPKSFHVLSELYEEKGVCLKIKASPGTISALSDGSPDLHRESFRRLPQPP
jgi:hypothetical protein